MFLINQGLEGDPGSAASQQEQPLTSTTDANRYSARLGA